MDKKILINSIDKLNQQYEHTDSVYKKALKDKTITQQTRGADGVQIAVHRIGRARFD